MFFSGWGNSSNAGRTEIYDISNVTTQTPTLLGYVTDLSSITAGNNMHSAWPSDDGKLMPADALTELIDIQIAACKALGLPDDMDLRTGDPTIDGIISPPRS